MICPSCKHQNPEGAVFCGECGAALNNIPRKEYTVSHNGMNKPETAEMPAPAVPVSYPAAQQKAGKETKGKGKKRRFPVALVVILLLFVISAAWVGVSVYGSSLLEKELPVSPFAFTGTLDSENYVSEDFTVGGAYNLPKSFGKLHWSCKSDSIELTDNEDGSADADVTRPKETETVKVFVTCRYLFGMARKSYTLKLAPKPSLTVSSVKVPDERRLNGKTTTVYRDDNGTVTEISGDLGSVTVGCAEDAETVADAYRQIMTVPDEYDIVCGEIKQGANIVFYQMTAIQEGYPVVGEYFTVATTEDQKLLDVKNAIVSAPAGDLNDRVLSESMDLASIVSAYLLETGYGTSTEIYAMQEGPFIYSGTLTYGCYAVCSDGKVYDVLVDAGDGIVTKCQENTGDTAAMNSAVSLLQTLGTALFVKSVYDTAFDMSLENQRLTGTSEFGNKITVDGSYSSMTGKYYLIDEHRDIRIKSSENGVERFIGIGENVKSDTTEITDSVSLESMKWIQNAYDWYQASFGKIGWKSGNRIYCVTDTQPVLMRIPNNTKTDNAAANSTFSTIFVLPAEKFTTTMAASPMIMYHEYSHNVCASEQPFCLFAASDVDYVSINEAYADIFGFWIAEDTDGKQLPEEYVDWANGVVYRTDDREEPVCFRVPAYGLVSLEYDKNLDQMPSTYTQIKGDGHFSSLYISYVAYQMYFNGNEVCGLSPELVQRIWYDSMGFGFRRFWSTDINAIRRNVLSAADGAGCTTRQKEYIEDLFFEVGITDGQTERHNDPIVLTAIIFDEDTDAFAEGARITASYGGRTVTATTDRFGGFSLVGLPVGSYDITVEFDGKTFTLQTDAGENHFTYFTIHSGGSANGDAPSLPDEDEPDSDEANDAAAASDSFVVTIENPLGVFFTRKINVSVYTTRDYSDELQEEIKEKVEQNLLSSGNYISATVRIKKAPRSMIAKLNADEIPHGLNNAAPDADSITITSFEEWWYYLRKYLGMLSGIQFYVRGTGELFALH